MPRDGNRSPPQYDDDFEERDFDVDYKYDDDDENFSPHAAPVPIHHHVHVRADDDDLPDGDLHEAFSSPVLRSMSMDPADHERTPVRLVAADQQDEKLVAMFKEGKLTKDNEGNVYAENGSLLGKINEDEALVTHDGTIIGYLFDRANAPLPKDEIDPSAWLSSPSINTPAGDAITQYLVIPKTYHELQEKGGGVSLDGYKSDVSKVKAKKRLHLIKNFQEVSPLKEPEEGIFPMGFNIAEFEKARGQIEWVDMTPTFFSRKPIVPASELPPERVCEDFEMFISICNREVPGDQLTFLWIENMRKILPKQVKRDVGKYLRLTPNLEVLGLVGAGLHKIEQLKLKHLLLLDLSNNEISNVNDVGMLTAHSGKLRELNLLDNPIVKSHKLWKNDIPTINNEFWKVILNLSQLEVLNQKPIPSISRSRAMVKFGVKSQLVRVPMALWNLAMNDILASSGMKVWQPQVIERLELPGQGLRTFHVGMLRNLKFLDLSNNFIASLLGCGLEQTTKVYHLDLRNNMIEEKSNQGTPLKPIRYLTSLKQLFLAGNPMKEYHSSVIYLTAHLKGSNRSPGLLELDGVKVSVEERVKAFQLFTKDSADVHRERWRLNMIHNFGNLQIRSIENFFGKVRQLKLSNRSLKEVFLEDFVSLELLDLSRNALRIARGLEQLTNLKYLDLSENAPLSVPKTIKQLKSGPMTKLVSVNILPDRKHADHKLYMKLLTDLSEHNHCLEVVNDVVVELDDRVSVYSSTIRGLNVGQYKLNLALTISAASDVTSYHPDEVGVGMQYSPGTVTELLELNHLGLNDQDLDFSPFVNLQKLNLANNKFTDILSIGLENLSKLTWLDVRNCKINNSPTQIAGLIDRLEHLEVLAIRGNPCLHNRRDRIKILKSCNRLQDFDCGFRVLDTEITVAERIEAWSARGDAKEDPEVMQYKAALRLRTPAGVPLEKVEGLDLSEVGISTIDLTGYTGLKKLKLNGNKLSTLSGTGIDKLKSLVVLDLRSNELSSIDEIVNVVSKLKNLEYLGISGNRISHNARAHLLHSLPTMRSIENRLRFMDETWISINEILENIDDEFRGKDQMERFRWDLALRRALSKDQVAQPQQVMVLDLSNCSLTYTMVSWFTKLEELDLSRNKISDADLKTSGIEKVSTLRILDLSFNSLHHMQQTCEQLCKLSNLESIALVGNKFFPEDSPKYRSEFLKAWKGIGSNEFKLKRINARPVGIEERLEAVHDALSERDAQRIKMDMLISGFKNPDQVTTLDLSDKGFSYIDGIQKLRHLEVLDLSHNKLTTLTDQFLHELPFLHTLNISHNAFDSLEEIFVGLSKCHRLKHLELICSTKDPRETKDPSRYADVVGANLRGLETIDDVENPHQLSQIQKEAQVFLYTVADVGPNSLIHVDISDKNLSIGLYFLILCALKECECVKTFRASGNLWNKGKDRIRNYRQYAIYALGSSLKIMDGEKILDVERLNAIDLCEGEEKQGIKHIKKGGWIAHKDEAKEAEDKYVKEREKKEAKGGPNLFDIGEKGVNRAVNVQGRGFKSGNTSVDSALNIVSGTLLNKLEIAINFLQVYALVLTIDVAIPWPAIFIDFSSWIRFFSFDIDWVFDLNLPYQQEIKFLLIVTLPAFFLLMYSMTTRVNMQKWKDRYGENWRSTRTTVLSLWAALMVFVVVIAFIMYPDSITNVRNGSGPTNQTNGIIVVIGGTMSLMFTIYLMIIHSFRVHFVGVDEQKFQRWWFKKLYQIRRISLFMLTILFMPVSRMIFLQFQCNSDTQTLTVYPTRSCPNVQIYGIQIAGIVFGVAYIIGIPYFFRRLIRTAVKMVDAHGYRDEESLFKNMLKRKADKDPEGIKSKNYRELNKEAKEHLRKFYQNEVKNNPMPQTYLYAAYERKFRYFKIIQMFEKLLVVVITMFIPTVISFMKVAVGSGLLAAFAVISITFRPFNDQFEDWMDIISQSTNTLNMFIALFLKLGWSNNLMSGGFLILINLITLVIFVVVIISGMIRKCRRKKEEKKKKGTKKDKKKGGKYGELKPSASMEMQNFLNQEDKEYKELEDELDEERGK